MTDELNPKDVIGVRKAGMSAVSCAVLMELGLAMLEGAVKHGRHNYRVAPVRSSVYYDATWRHLMAWWEGEDLDPDSGPPGAQLSHVTKAIASLTVLRDAMINGKVVDDRPPPLPAGWVERYNGLAGEIIDRIPDAKPPFTAVSREPESFLEEQTGFNRWTWERLTRVDPVPDPVAFRPPEPVGAPPNYGNGIYVEPAIPARSWPVRDPHAVAEEDNAE